MTQHDPLLPLRHMLEFAREAIEFGGGLSAEQIEADRQVRRALERDMELIGESATRVPQSLRHQLPSLAWRRIVGLRNILIHRYDGIDYSLVADALANEVQTLARTLEEFLGEQAEESP